MLPISRSAFCNNFLIIFRLECFISSILVQTFENQKSKCSQYWPIKASMPRLFEQFSVSLESCCQSSEYNISSLILTYNDGQSPPQTRKITHFHYHAWPDFGIPDSPDSFLKFLCLVRQQNPESSPPVIHCSAGKQAVQLSLKVLLVTFCVVVQFQNKLGFRFCVEKN